ncbi:hypothetical protein AAHA92_16037 [Salvia divinorum]|uniref:Uncharacterized protein n=1 Tax=Salvia divinorum TaxID=28513 RepID=A0ABD1GUC3_SALDI
MKAFIRVTALHCAYILTTLAFFSMQDYLTIVWKLSLTHAAGFLNMWKGITMIFTLFPIDTVLEKFKILLISSITYSVGFGFITMSTPPVLAKATMSCKSYAPECIGNIQKVIFYTGMTLIAIGIAGNQNNSMTTFLKEPNEETPDNNRVGNQTDIEENATGCGYFDPLRRYCQVQSAVMLLVAAIVGATTLPFVKPWSIGIPAVFTMLATIFFTTGWKGYRRVQPKGSPVINVRRVFVAAFELSQPFLPSSEDYYKIEGEQVLAFLSTHLFRRLHKVAIIVHGDLREDNKAKMRRKLCSVEEVEDAKIALQLLVPMWMTLIVCGMVELILPQSQTRKVILVLDY